MCFHPPSEEGGLVEQGKMKRKVKRVKTPPPEIQTASSPSGSLLRGRIHEVLDQTDSERGVARIDVGYVLRFPLVDVVHHQPKALPDRGEVALAVSLLQ